MGTQGRARSRCGIAIIAFILALYCQAAEAQVKTDIRTDGTLGAKVAVPGPQAEIPASLGRRAGKNLFHSFARFNVGTGDSATFTGPGGLDNVISRVTGGERSAIDGRLASKIPSADFWFINPAGLAFGPNASLDVPASFHVSTADELRFPGGEVFSATEPAKSVLSVAPPEAFGFLGAKPAPINVEVGAGKALSLSSPGETLSFTGGDINVTGRSGGGILAPGGEIDFVSLSSPGEVRLPGAVATAPNLGPVHIKGPPPDDNRVRFVISSSGIGGGTIKIRGGQVVANDVAFALFNSGEVNATGGMFITADDLDFGGVSYIFTSSLSNSLPGKVDIDANSVRMTGASVIGTFDFDTSSPSGAVSISADTVEIDGTMGNVGIITTAMSDAPGGAITITAHDALRLYGDGALISSAAISGSGDAGPITINANNIVVEGSARVAADAKELSTGKGGAVTVTGAVIHLTNGGRITSTTSGSRPGGVIRIEPHELLMSDGGVIDTATSGSGNAGIITISGKSVVLKGGARVAANADESSTGKGGDVTINADTVEIDGTRRNSSIGTFTLSNAGGGAIAIDATESVRLYGAGAIIASGTLSGGGDAGPITVSASSITVEGGALVAAGTLSSSTGKGGDVTVTGDVIRLEDGGQITSTARGSGPGGLITIHADKELTVRDGARISGDALASSTGKGGDVMVTGDVVRLENGGEITSTSTSSGSKPGGLILVAARKAINMSGGSAISAETSGTGGAGRVGVGAPRISVNNSYIGANTTGKLEEAGDAGPVVILAPERMEFTNEGRVFNGTEGPGNGGTIFVYAGDLIADKQPIDHPHINHTGISANSQAGSSGQGGNVIVEAASITLRNGAQITSDTKGTGNAGSVDITTSTLHLENEGLIGTCSGAGPDCKDRTSSPGTTGDAGDITVRATEKIVLDDGKITTFARSEKAEGGRITLQAGDLIYLKDSEVTSEVFGGQGTTAGDISIDPEFVVLDNSRILARATEGRGGNIRITADNLVRSQDSLIDASSELGVDGTVATSTPEADVTSGLVVLPAAFLDAASRLRDSCAVRGAGEASRFSRAGRTLPAGPGDPQVASYASAADTEAGAAAETDTFAEAPGALMIVCGPPRP